MVWGVGGVEMPSSRYSHHSLQSAACTTPPLHCIHITRIKHHLIDFIEHAWAALLETIFIWPEKLYLWFSLKPQCYNLHRNGCPFTINRTKSELLPIIKPNDGWWWRLCHCLQLLQFPGLWSRTSLLHPFDCVTVSAGSAELELGTLIRGDDWRAWVLTANGPGSGSALIRQSWWHSYKHSQITLSATSHFVIWEENSEYLEYGC